MISEKWTEKDVTGSRCSLIKSTMPEFAYSDWGKSCVFCEDSLSTGRYLNPRLLDYESER
jgi:hypothetical protein